MTNQKNPLRTLATKIKEECNKSGLKHTVILKALTENVGFHSIQCADKLSSAKNNSAKEARGLPEHVSMYLKGVLCNVLFESSSYDFYKEGDLDATLERTNDSLTTALLTMMKDEPLKLISNVGDYYDGFYELCDSLEEAIEDKEESSLVAHFTSKSLPICLSKAFVTEVFSACDHNLEFNEWIGEAISVAFAQVADLENVAKALENSEVAQSALDHNAQLANNIAKESAHQSKFNDAINNSFVLAAPDEKRFLSGGSYSPYSFSEFDLDTVIVNKSDALSMASNSTSLIPKLEQAQGLSVLKPLPLIRVAPDLVKTLSMNEKDLEEWASMKNQSEYPYLTGFNKQAHSDDLNEGKTELSYWAWVESQIASFIDDSIEW